MRGCADEGPDGIGAVGGGSGRGAAMNGRIRTEDIAEVRARVRIDEVIGENAVEGVRVRDTETDELDVIPAAAMFVAIGHTPNTELFAGSLAFDEDGYILTDGTRTNVEGVFACGDVQDTVYRQAITAAGSGCEAAIDAERWLEATEHHAQTAAA